MKKVIIQTNTFFLIQRPTTQDDNHGGIIDAWTLFFDEACTELAGRLLKHNMDVYIVLHPNAIRYSFAASDIGFM